MNRIKNILPIILATTFILPGFAHAQLEGIESFLIAVRRLMNLTIPVLIGLAVVYFMWGAGQFILNDAANEKTREDGKKKMFWGVIALFVMISLFGIIAFIGNTLGIPTGINPTNAPASPTEAIFGGISA